MKVIKFGGSSLASAEQLKKVLNIVKSDNERRFVVVSAPGKRNSEDTKVTDALIQVMMSLLHKNGLLTVTKPLQMSLDSVHQL
jgi:aspartokinase